MRRINELFFHPHEYIILQKCPDPFLKPFRGRSEIRLAAGILDTNPYPGFKMVKFEDMRRLFSHKRFIVFLSILSVITIVLLASGLHNIEFRAGRALGRAEAETVQFSVERAIRAITDVPVWKQTIFWVLLFLLVLLVSSILSPEIRKRLIRSFLGFAIATWAIIYLVQNNLLVLPDFTADLERGLAESAEEPPPFPVFTPPEVPDWINFLISLGIILALVGITWGLVRWWRRLSYLRSLSKPLGDLAAIAQSSLDDLAAGYDWDDVIFNCYARMSDVVGRKQGLVRQEDMTPAEFARRLERAGLPGDPVRRLTRLFESVRYGTRESSQKEINEAVSCLTAILHYCGEAP